MQSEEEERTEGEGEKKKKRGQTSVLALCPSGNVFPSLSQSTSITISNTCSLISGWETEPEWGKVLKLLLWAEFRGQGRGAVDVRLCGAAVAAQWWVGHFLLASLVWGLSETDSTVPRTGQEWTRSLVHCLRIVCVLSRLPELQKMAGDDVTSHMFSLIFKALNCSVLFG